MNILMEVPFNLILLLSDFDEPVIKMSRYVFFLERKRIKTCFLGGSVLDQRLNNLSDLLSMMFIVLYKVE